MATYVLVPGADGAASYWDLVAPRLRDRGHEVVTLDLPGQDTATFDDFADAITAAILALPGLIRPLVVVGQSLGGFSAPLVCARLAVDGLVLVNPMVPRPGESAGDWWADTGQAEARLRHAEESGRHGAAAEFDVRTDFFHDVPAEITERILSGPEPGGPPAGVWGPPWPLEKWPDVPTRVLQGRDDRFFPLEFQRRVVRDRLGLDVEELPGGHLVALSRPAELTEALLRAA
ncbi:alpha/beta fold hydrolase [Actinacidiphila acididurans]|uniref:Alpha/beta fold hydrolase n=1 Tax=Actinacidiphila acididurans TaxID=2784346 RepID=A0ABS2TUQ5_9ACTN|nr:alpha/beta fold hydrolase [Actinacidiphila acididurans]MBM9507062.1 alpha/beta fold hydrolase [Actinacidiphila acididurans]